MPFPMTRALPLVLLLIGFASGQIQRKPLDIIPEDAYAYLGFCGLMEACQSAEHLGLYQIAKLPGIQEFFAPVLEGLRDTTGVPGDANQSNADSTNALPLLDRAGGAVGLAILGVNLGSGSRGLPQVLLTMDVPGDHTGPKAMIVKLLQRMGSESELTETAFRGVPLQVMKVGEQGSEQTVCMASIDNLIVVSLGEAALRKAINLTKSETAKPLPQNEAYARGRSKAPKAPTVEFYFNVEKGQRLLRLASFLIPDEAFQAIEDLGLLSIRSLHFASAAHDGDTFTSWYVDCPRPRSGILNLSGGRGLSKEILTLIPSTALGFVAGRLDASVTLDQLSKVSQRIPGMADPRRMLEGVLRSNLPAPWFQVWESVAPHLGSEVLAFVDLHSSWSLPKGLLALELKDPEGFRAQMGTWLELLPFEHQAFEENGQQIHLIWPTRGGVPMSPCFTVRGNHMLLSPTLSGLREALLRAKNGKPTFLEGDAVSAAFRGLHVDDAAGIHYVDTARLLKLGYESMADLLPGLSAQISMGSALNWHKLPPVDQITPHLRGMAGVWTGDEHGLLSKSRGIGFASLLGLGARSLYEFRGRPLEQMLNGLGVGDDFGAAPGK